MSGGCLGPSSEQAEIEVRLSAAEANVGVLVAGNRLLRKEHQNPALETDHRKALDDD